MVMAGQNSPVQSCVSVPLSADSVSLCQEVSGIESKVEMLKGVEQCVAQVVAHLNASNSVHALESLECIHQMVLNSRSDIHQRLARLRRSVTRRRLFHV